METEAVTAPTKKTDTEVVDELLGLLVSTCSNIDHFCLGHLLSFTPQTITQLYEPQLQSLQETVVVTLQAENHRHLLAVQET